MDSLYSANKKDIGVSATMKNWPDTELHEIVKSTQLGTPVRWHRSSQEGVPLIKMGNLVWGGIDLTNIEKISKYDIESDNVYVSFGDLLFNTRNTPDLVGKSAVWRGHNYHAVFDNNINRIRFIDSVVPEFFEAYLNNGIGKRKIRRLAVGSTSVAAIYWKDLRRIRVPFPPYREQQKISQILQAWDEAIETLDALYAASERRYRALAQKFFEPCHPSSDKCPSGWRKVALGDVFTERRQQGKVGDRLLSITMNEGIIDREAVGRRDVSAEDKTKYKLIRPGDIGYNTMRMWQGVSALSNVRGIVSPAYTVVTPDENRIRGKYAAHLFKAPRIVFEFERYSQGLTSDTWNLKFSAFSKIKILLPPVELQERQSSVLDSILGEMKLIQKKRVLIKRQKRGVMQKLLSGQWRV